MVPAVVTVKSSIEDANPWLVNDPLPTYHPFEIGCSSSP